MRLDKFTIKAQEALQTSQQIAERFNNQQIEPEHLMLALMEQKEGVIPSLLGKLGAEQARLVEDFEAAVDKFPKVSGAGMGQVYISPRTKNLLDRAFIEAEQMKDEFVSLEHILLAAIEEKDGDAAKILVQHGVTRETV
ncbi:MAG TPA: type VI secretion system ATPase TssH, partial [Desulfobacterales bacterium]|nr:type VI secretion system ATPase TssH [Desulfobacterales bacterium]